MIIKFFIILVIVLDVKYAQQVHTNSRCLKEFKSQISKLIHNVIGYAFLLDFHIVLNK